MRVLVLVLLVAMIPAVALAGNALLGGPLVSCDNPPQCQACDLLKTANNILRFAVAFTVFVATLAFAYAGVLYFTAAADPKNIEKAHSIFKKVLIGLIIVLVSWLLVDIIVKTLTGDKWGPWNEISCVNWPSAGVLARGPSGVATNPAAPQTGANIPPQGRCEPMTAGPCTVENLTPIFGQNAAAMSSVCRWESSGRSSCSGTDKLWDGGQSFSCGPFMNNITTNIIYCPNGDVHDCRSIFNPPSDPNARRTMCFAGIGCDSYRAGAGWGFTLKPGMETQYQQCTNWANDFSCSAETAKRKLGNTSNPNFRTNWYHWSNTCGSKFGI